MTPRPQRKHRLRMLLAGTAVLAGVAGYAALPASAENASNGYPYCSNGSAADSDGDGWGWENSASCVVRGGKADPGGGSGGSGGSSGNASNGYPYCRNGSASDSDGDGWGWESSASCIVKGSKADPGAAGGGGSTGGSSTACPSGTTCGSYTVSGLGSRKQQVRNAGGNALDLATAMLETDTMQTNYAYGDNKTSDAANFGIFKQNWGMLRVACSRFKGQSASQWNNGAVLNSNLSADIQCLHESQSYYGTDRWFAGHRNGSSGLSNPNTSDIQMYRNAVYWIRDRLNSNSANLSNDTRYWVSVPPI